MSPGVPDPSPETASPPSAAPGRSRVSPGDCKTSGRRYASTGHRKRRYAHGREHPDPPPAEAAVLRLLSLSSSSAQPAGHRGRQDPARTRRNFHRKPAHSSRARNVTKPQAVETLTPYLPADSVLGRAESAKASLSHRTIRSGCREIRPGISPGWGRVRLWNPTRSAVVFFDFVLQGEPGGAPPMKLQSRGTL